MPPPGMTNPPSNGNIHHLLQNPPFHLNQIQMPAPNSPDEDLRNVQEVGFIYVLIIFVRGITNAIGGKEVVLAIVIATIRRVGVADPVRSVPLKLKSRKENGNQASLQKRFLKR